MRYFKGIAILIGAITLLGCTLISSLIPTATPEPSPTPRPTNTPSPTATPQPTPTPTATPQPTATEELVETALPTLTPIPGWQKFEGGGAEIWLPSSFEGGNLDDDLEMIAERLRQLGPEYEQTARMLEQNPSAFALWVFDTQVGSSGFLTNMNITKERVFSGITLETYLDMAVNQLPEPFHVVDRSLVDLHYYQAGRIVVEFTISGVQGKEIFFSIQDENVIWNIIFATSKAEFEERLPTFEQSANTFYVKP